MPSDGEASIPVFVALRRVSCQNSELLITQPCHHKLQSRLPITSVGRGKGMPACFLMIYLADCDGE